MSNRFTRQFSLPQFIAAVIAIVFVAALVYPVIGQSKNGGRNPCLSRMKQLGVGMLMYTSENDEHFMTSAHAAPGADWGPAIYPYVLRTAVFHCPTDRTDPPRPQQWPQGAGLCPTHVYSYALNSNLPGAQVISDNGKVVRKPAVGHATLANPDRTVMFFEVSGAVGRIVPVEHPIDAESPTGNTTSNPLLANVPGRHPGQRYPDGINPDVRLLHAYYATGNVGRRILNGSEGSLPRHGEVAYYLAADGHVQALRPEKVSGGADATYAECDEGTLKQSAPCDKQKSIQAAGTVHPAYVMTFSSI